MDVLSKLRHYRPQLPGFSLSARFYWLLALLLAFFVTAHLLVQIAHQTRIQQVQLQRLEAERDALQVEWGRLLLEESALVSPARMEQLAQQLLELHLPEPGELEIREVQ